MIIDCERTYLPRISGTLRLCGGRQQAQTAPRANKVVCSVVEHISAIERR